MNDRNVTPECTREGCPSAHPGFTHTHLDALELARPENVEVLLAQSRSEAAKSVALIARADALLARTKGV